MVEPSDASDALDTTTDNRFAHSLVDHLAQRATGRDEATARFLNVPPAEPAAGVPAAGGANTPADQASAAAPRQTEIVQVWSRVDLPPLEVAIPVDEILAAGHRERALTTHVRDAWQTWTREHARELYPRGKRIELSESQA